MQERAPMTDPSPASFSRQLRDATDEAHQRAERSAFVEDLVGGRLPRAELARFLVQLHDVYAALEVEVDVARATDSQLAPFLAPELARLDALDADLRHLAGRTWRDDYAVLPSTASYCDRIRDASRESSGGLLAHHYVRYLGDLSGGQFLGRALARVYELPDGE